MKKIIAILFCTVMIMCINETCVFAQQKSIVTLIETSFNGASHGFPSLINDTVSDFGAWQYKIDPRVVQQFAGVKEIKIRVKKNYKSILMKDTLVQLNQMRIRADNISIPEGKTWNDYKDTLTSHFSRQVDFFKKAFESRLNYTNIIPLENESQSGFSPRYKIYFYSKSLTIPEKLTTGDQIEDRLDATSWFTVELQEQSAGLAHYFNMVYRISGGQRKTE